jgi:hypothetical protein
MTLMLGKALSEAQQQRKLYKLQKKNSEIAFQETKTRCKLLMGEPEVIAGVFAVGLYKGAQTDNPKTTKNKAILSIARTTLTQFLA